MSASTSSSPAPSAWAEPRIVTVAPNGARAAQPPPGLAHHPAALATTARACRDAGAAMLHMHIRDAQGRHSLDVEGGAIREATRAARAAVGDGMVIQITSEAAARPHSRSRWSRPCGPKPCSVGRGSGTSPRSAKPGWVLFFNGLARQGTMTQVILYDNDACNAGRDLRQRGVVVMRLVPLFVLGAPQRRADLPPTPLLLPARDQGPDWPSAPSADGERLHHRRRRAGGHARVGFREQLALQGRQPRAGQDGPGATGRGSDCPGPPPGHGPGTCASVLAC